MSYSTALFILPSVRPWVVTCRTVLYSVGWNRNDFIAYGVDSYYIGCLLVYISQFNLGRFCIGLYLMEMYRIEENPRHYQSYRLVSITCIYLHTVLISTCPPQCHKFHLRLHDDHSQGQMTITIWQKSVFFSFLFFGNVCIFLPIANHVDAISFHVCIRFQCLRPQSGLVTLWRDITSLYLIIRSQGYENRWFHSAQC